jgi:DNA-binding NarL/FixJ family response regulator
MSIRLLIAEGHALVREGLRGAFEHTDIQVAGEAATGDEAIRLALDDCANVVLLDIRIPDQHGFEVLRRLRALRPNVAVVIYSQSERSDYKKHARELGASGFLTKRVHKSELIDAIKKVSSGARLWEMPGKTPANSVDYVLD